MDASKPRRSKHLSDRQTASLLTCGRFVSTEEPAEGQGPSEHDAVQHADAAQERQAEGEVSGAAVCQVRVRVRWVRGPQPLTPVQGTGTRSAAGVGLG